MLKDRRVLVEQELQKAQHDAGRLYLQIVRSDDDACSTIYQALKERITDLQSDLNIINNLIEAGHN